MWDLDNRSPFAAERCFARDAQGVEHFVVAVRASFDVHADGSLRVAAVQTPVVQAPVYRGEPTCSSLLADVDLVLGKPSADVLLLGHAHAPDQRPVRELAVELRVGAHSKTIMAVGERRWERLRGGWRLAEPAPFVRVPLVYELAYGGVKELANPAGRALAEGAPAPQLELPAARIEALTDRPGPAGFGPIAPHWSPRRELAGTFDETWRRERMPLPPQDADLRRLQAAPADQQRALIGGEPIQLRHCTPSGLLRCAVPRVQFRWRSWIAGAWVDHRPEIRTVVVDADAARLSVVWHSAIECHTTLYRLRSTEIAVEYADFVLPPANDAGGAHGL